MKALVTLSALAVLAALPLLPPLGAQELPEGKGKELVQSTCSSCHGLESVVSQRADKDGWQNIVDYMLSRGMIATDDEVKLMVEYLAAVFPAQPKGKTAPPKP
jgi:cytochrome c5